MSNNDKNIEYSECKSGEFKKRVERKSFSLPDNVLFHPADSP